MLLAASQQAFFLFPATIHLAPPPLATACLSFSEAGLGHTSSFHLHQLTPAGSDIIFSHVTCTYTTTYTISPLQQLLNDFISSSATILLALLLTIAIAICTEEQEKASVPPRTLLLSAESNAISSQPTI